MHLDTVEVSPVGARRQAADYAREAKRARDPRERRELEQLAHAYRVASRENVALIALTPTIEAGGTTIRTRVYGRGDNERREHFLVPRLAACTWRAAFVYTSGVRRDGSVGFSDSLRRRFDYRSGVLELETRFELPADFEAAGDGSVATHWSAWTAMVPIVPPRHRPARGLGNRLVLWEAEDWTWSRTPAPPGDPALLSHVGGDLYAVEATWDLTELERLVLSGRQR